MENKQKRITLKTIHEMLDGMSVELAEKVHLLFMANYIDYSDYEFRDEDQVESYCWCYMHCSSRFIDMLCDAQAQYGDYSELEKCPMLSPGPGPSDR